MIEAWHFVTGDTLRDGQPVPADGELLKREGMLSLGESGLHASRRIIDALEYAPGPICCRVQVGGEIIEGNDKLVAAERTILWRVDATDVLRKFARDCALDVIHLWDAPDVVRVYLTTGDDTLRAATWDAARDAAWDAAKGAAWDAAWDAAREAQNRRLEMAITDARR